MSSSTIVQSVQLKQQCSCYTWITLAVGLTMLIKVCKLESKLMRRGQTVPDRGRGVVSN